MKISIANYSKDASSYEWDFGDNSASSNAENPDHFYTKTGFHNVVLTANNDFGCEDTTSHHVAVAFDKIFPPNAFSPNAFNEEDREFRIHAEGISDKGYQLLVFDRWGEVIFESKNREKGWKGKMKNGNFAPAGVYAGVISYNDFMGDKHKQQGAVTFVF